MKVRKLLSLRNILIMLGLLIVIGAITVKDKVYIVVNEEANIYLEKHLGESWGKVLSYTELELGKSLSLVFPHYYNPEKEDVVIINTKDERDILSSVVNHYSKFNYVGNQANPSLVMERGGNCQAISLLLYDTFKANGLKTGLVLDNGIEHMSTWVIVNDVKYNVDLVKQIVEVL